MKGWIPTKLSLITLLSSSRHPRPLTSSHCQLLLVDAQSTRQLKYVGTGDPTRQSLCEEKTTDVGEDGKLVETFFTVGESTAIPESDVLSERGDEIVARENSNRTNADNCELVEQIRLMRLATVGAFRDLEKKMDRMEHRHERRVIALQAEIRELKEQLSCRSTESGLDFSIFSQDRLEALLSLKHGSITKFALAVEQELFEDNPLELLKNVEDRIYSAKRNRLLAKGDIFYSYINEGIMGKKCYLHGKISIS
ncbi:unnamed protein product [Haemonchus placei]|uniref:Tick transposon n=1 Tax=Haemonchus placei TaxID=6290 RepID=A0A0N4VU80_HAEPC|nr:unnamed protein product [Haemonchus placei]